MNKYVTDTDGVDVWSETQRSLPVIKNLMQGGKEAQVIKHKWFGRPGKEGK